VYHQLPPRVAIVCFTMLGLATAPICAQQSAPPSAAEALPSITLPSALDRVLRDYERAWRAGDVAALVALFTDDGFVMQPGRPPARGHAALAAVYRGQGGSPLRLRPLAYATADSVGYIIGAYAYGEDPADQGKFTLTLRRDRAGRWLIASDMDNGSRPAGRPAASPTGGPPQFEPMP
jgi:ketosteroid isomerase-like protein